METKRYTSDEVAEAYRVSRHTVYRWMREGKLRGVKVGRAYLFTEDAIREFEEGCGSGKPVPCTV